MSIYYASLVRGLCGYYVKFRAPSEEVVRLHLATYFGRMWCSVYTPEQMNELAGRFPTTIINEDKPIDLTTGEWE
jgi:hypothetical protein